MNVPYDKQGEDGKFEPTYDPDDFVTAVGSLDLPTTSDVADCVECPHRTALHHLNQLEDTGRLVSRKVGPAKVWRVSEERPSDKPDVADAGQETPQEDAGERDLSALIDAVAEEWEDTDERLEARKAAARAVLDYAREHGGVSQQEAKEEVFPEHPVEGQNARTWYRKNIRPVLNEAAEYDQSERAYKLLDDLDT